MSKTPSTHYRPKSFIGRGKTVEQAVDAAYRRARGNQTGHLTFRIEEIYVTGSNPISEYTVQLGPTP